MTTVTQHYIERAHERLGLNYKEAVNLSARAVERGKRYYDMPKLESMYMREKEEQGECRSVFYNNSLFVFSLDGTCITVYEAPEWFGQKQHYRGKERIRNVRRYYRNYLDQ